LKKWRREEKETSVGDKTDRNKEKPNIPEKQGKLSTKGARRTEEENG